MLTLHSNIANTYQALGRKEEALSMRRDVYSRRLRLNGEEYEETLRAAYSYAVSLNGLQRFKEAKALMRKMMPVARRVLGENHDITLSMRSIYASVLFADPGATLDDLREALTTLEDAERIARRMLGGAHPDTVGIGHSLQVARAALRAREKTPPPGSA